MAAEVNQRLSALRSQLEGAAAERAQREQENEQLAARLVEWQSEREQAEAREQQLASESDQVRARIAEIELELKAAREVLDGVRDRRGELSVQAAKCSS